MDELVQFRGGFRILTDHESFPWQEDLYARYFSQGSFPASCNLPTGLGKTSVIAIWLIALINHPDRTPRRLVYVVNRRTVVDQTTDEVEKLRENLSKLKDLPEHARQLAISTLRGQFADNHEWSADPSRPAVICGTVDMIGSRLLFSGYGLGFKTKPLHAGFLGQDVLIVHDEAHLEPAFQKLLIAIEKEQREGERSEEMPWPKLRVMELTATSRGNGVDGKEALPFELTDAEKDPPEVIPDPPAKPIHIVWRRQMAKKAVRLHENQDESRLADQIADLALGHKNSGLAVLVFVRSIADLDKVAKRLPSDSTLQLTGTLRGLERDELVNRPTFQRFLSEPNRKEDVTPTPGTVYLVCTSAGEVGVNISADHMVCDLSTFEGMTQRFGRVNRFGDRDDTRIDIVYPGEFGKKDRRGVLVIGELDQRRQKTLDLLKLLKGNASPAALGRLDPAACLAAFAPTPRILPATDILFDAWALTTIRGRLPGRPPVEPYLHGISDWQAPETHVAWREEVGLITGSLLDSCKPEDLLEDYPLKPHELLRDRSQRVFKHLTALAEQRPEDPVWLCDNEGTVERLTLRELTDKDRDRRINYRTVLLPPSAGGLRDGMLNGDSDMADDVADDLWDESNRRRRVRVWDEDPQFDEKIEGMRLIRTIGTQADADEEGEESALNGRRYWHWYELPKVADTDGSRFGQKGVQWGVHTDDVARTATKIVQRMQLCKELQDAVILAGRFHDLGKQRPLFQRILGNVNTDVLLAKSGKPFHLREDYRHEFGSLISVENESEFIQLSDDMKDLVRHLIAAHHGRGRPHFPPGEVFDPEPKGRDVSAIASNVPRRFARLQRKYGRWGLAYLESLLRAADYEASARPSALMEDDQ